MLLVGIFKQETLGVDTGQEEGEADTLLPVLSVSFVKYFLFLCLPSNTSSPWQRHFLPVAAAEASLQLPQRLQSELSYISLQDASTFLKVGPKLMVLSLKLRHRLWGTEFQFSGPFL